MSVQDTKASGCSPPFQLGKEGASERVVLLYSSCARCGRATREAEYCHKCTVVLKTGKAPDP